jgi:hypothetical protein
MKHKHAEVIIAWANGAQIQVKAHKLAWEDRENPLWDTDSEYRIKPVHAKWQQDLIDAVKSGKVVEFESGGIWFPCRINDDPNSYDFHSSPVTKYRIKPEEKAPVVRWLWAKLVLGEWMISPAYRSKEEASKFFNGQVICLEWSRQEFPE